jgi:acyl-CoA dehydrogenase
MAWDFSTEPEYQKKLDWVREFVERELRPLDFIYNDLTQEQLQRIEAPLQAEVKRQGLWAAHLDPELGGQGLGQLKLALLHEILGRYGVAPEVFGNQAPDSGNAELLAVGANEEQKQRWLWPLLDGKVRSSFALTEPFVASSDPTAIRTMAVRDGDEWVITGHKWFASNADIADFILAMVVTDPEAPPHARAAMIVIERGTPGLEIVRNVGTMAHPDPSELERKGRVGGHTEIRFRDCRVPAANMIGKPGEGFLLAQRRLGGGRIHHAMRMIGQCQRAFEMMCERAVSRETRGKPLGQHQMMQDLIAESAVDIETARLLTLKAAWSMDHAGGKVARKDIAMVKYYAAKVLFNVIDRAIQMYGAMGYSTDVPLEWMYRQARAMRIADGADEVHKLTISKEVLRGAKVKQGWPTEHVPTNRAAALQKFAALLEQRAANL